MKLIGENFDEIKNSPEWIELRGCHYGGEALEELVKYFSSILSLQ